MDTIQVIELEDHDDINSTRDRILSAPRARVLLVIPWDSPSLRKPVDLQVAQRQAAANGIDLAIVSAESEIRAAARDVGASTSAPTSSVSWRSRRQFSARRGDSRSNSLAARTLKADDVASPRRPIMRRR